MKIRTSRFIPCLMALALLASCGGSDKENKSAPAPKVTAGKADSLVTGALPNYRYVDGDSVLSRYNLANDFMEQMIKKQSGMEAEMKKLEQNITTQQKVMQDKYQSGQYQSESDMQGDQKRLAELQKSAEEKMAQLQEEILKLTEKNQKTVTDSINKFIEEYNKTRGYDAIFFKAATLYINPALDITDEVVEGLNARYNKVKK